MSYVGKKNIISDNYYAKTIYVPKSDEWSDINPPSECFISLEDGYKTLQEDGSGTLLEACETPPTMMCNIALEDLNDLLLEGGALVNLEGCNDGDAFFFLLEDGSFLLQEDDSRLELE